jgi:hypothetical protein
MPLGDDDVELLIIQLSVSLAPSQRSAFIDAARSALARIDCIGPGLAFRILAPLQRQFFDPPADDAMPRTIGLHMGKRSKLNQAQPIGASDPREGGRARNQLRTG